MASFEPGRRNVQSSRERGRVESGAFDVILRSGTPVPIPALPRTATPVKRARAISRIMATLRRKALNP
jgi:hypothetical protein